MTLTSTPWLRQLPRRAVNQRWGSVQQRRWAHLKHRANALCRVRASNVGDAAHIFAASGSRPREFPLE